MLSRYCMGLPRPANLPEANISKRLGTAQAAAFGLGTITEDLLQPLDDFLGLALAPAGQVVFRAKCDTFAIPGRARNSCRLLDRPDRCCGTR